MSPARPVVLAAARRGAGVADGVAPGLAELGVFLPATPLQQLLFDGGPDLLVMTSGNLSEEPIARTNDEARTRLEGVADALLMHDREVHTRADDSVVRIVAGAPALLRTSSSSGGTHMPVSEMRTMMNAGTNTLNAAEVAKRSTDSVKR